jgi:Arc/MetJ-type ribon-helix-helix transcriptional regulator
VPGKVISVRLDPAAAAALRRLEGAGLSRSEAVRRALLAAAERQASREELIAEVRAVAADEDDRREKAAISDLLDEISEPW